MKNLITAAAFLAFGYAASAQTVPDTNGTNGTMTDTITTQPRSKSAVDQELYKSDTIHSSTRKTEKTSTTKSKTDKKKSSPGTQPNPSGTNNGSTPNNGTGTQTNPSGTNSGTSPNNGTGIQKTP